MAEAKIKDFKDYQGPSSREWTVDIDLEALDSFQKKMYFDFLSCKSVSVTIELVGAVGTSGTVTGGWASRKRSKIFAMNTPVSMLLADNDTIEYQAGDLYGRLFVLDLSTIIFGTAGKIHITVTGKPY